MSWRLAKARALHVHFYRCSGTRAAIHMKALHIQGTRADCLAGVGGVQDFADFFVTLLG
jgi:hypothetical protein